ncbi:MAG: GIY-YIG nuclease family protein, partial [Lachnospiraceae bacterium]|nr:GIY-YIG nuclease family protein [Lachnospiraceae bacterium]
MGTSNLIVPEIDLPGIYGILNVTNGKMYIGSAINIKNRLKQQRVNMINWNGLNNLMSEDMKLNKDIFNFVFAIIKV